MKVSTIVALLPTFLIFGADAFAQSAPVPTDVKAYCTAEIANSKAGASTKPLTFVLPILDPSDECLLSSRQTYIPR